MKSGVVESVREGESTSESEAVKESGCYLTHFLSFK